MDNVGDGVQGGSGNDLLIAGAGPDKIDGGLIVPASAGVAPPGEDTVESRHHHLGLHGSGSGGPLGGVRPPRASLLPERKGKLGSARLASPPRARPKGRVARQKETA